ncbi:hypothetical protein HZS_4329 [Henneguya salminicola]|nr:hypothetical protein HZS_4329 [Henneguya salminicola]
MYRNYEPILLYIIQQNMNRYIKKKFTITPHLLQMENNYEIKLDYCRSIIRRVEFLEKKFTKKSYSRINGYWCENTIKTNPQMSFKF